MHDVGDLGQFGFRIGPVREDEHTVGHREVAIFINGCEVSPDHQVFLPSYIGALRRQSDVLKNRVNFELHAHFFRGLNLTEVHNTLLHNTHLIFRSDQEWWNVSQFHRFMNLDEPNTDLFVSYLLPWHDGLYLTYQWWNAEQNGFAKLDIVDGTRNKVLVYDLIRTIDQAIATLDSGE